MSTPDTTGPGQADIPILCQPIMFGGVELTVCDSVDTPVIQPTPTTTTIAVTTGTDPTASDIITFDATDPIPAATTPTGTEVPVTTSVPVVAATSLPNTGVPAGSWLVVAVVVVGFGAALRRLAGGNQ